VSAILEVKPCCRSKEGLAAVFPAGHRRRNPAHSFRFRNCVKDDDIGWSARFQAIGTFSQKRGGLPGDHAKNGL
jgi:hypothetical protein